MQPLVQVKVPVLVVAHDGVPLAGEVNPNLVGAPGFDGHLQQRHGGQPLQGPRRHGLPHLHQSNGAHAVRVVCGGDAHAALTVRLQVFVQGQVDDLVAGRPLTGDQRQVSLARFTLAKLVLQVGQR